MAKNFAITGVAGFVAPRHLEAIRATGNRLVAAVDPHDAARRRRDLDAYAPWHDTFRVHARRGAGPTSLRLPAHSVNMFSIPPMDASEATFGDEAGHSLHDGRLFWGQIGTHGERATRRCSPLRPPARPGSRGPHRPGRPT